MAPGGGTVVVDEEVEEAKLFVRQARYDLGLLPSSVRAFSDSALSDLDSLLAHAAAPSAVRRLTDSLSVRLEAAASGSAAPLPGSAPSLARGAVVYREQCAACHGDAGGGDGPKAKGLVGPPPANLADPAAMSTVSQVEVYRRILMGVPGTGMPEYESTLSEADRWAVTAFVMTLSSGGPGRGVAEVFTTARRQVDSAIALRSDRIAFGAYLTFEQVETGLRARDPSLVSAIEAEFGELRARATTATAGELGAVRARLFGSLERAERMVADRPVGATLFTQSFMLLLREGFEAILIIAALMTFLTKAGAPERRREVARGAWAAVGASVATAVAFELLVETTGGPRQALEGTTLLAAALVLFYVSYWLFSKIEADKWNAFLKSKLQAALTSGSGLALTSVAFLAVYREGVETLLFYKALLLSGGAGGAGAVAGGVALGAVGLVVLYIAILRLGVRIPMKPFFAVTGTLLYYMAFVFAGKGIAELQEGGIVGTTVIPALQWLRVPFLGVYPTVQSLSLQGVLLGLALVAVFVLLRPRSGATEPVGAR